VSNSRRLKLKPWEPDETERAFRAELRRGCPYCKSRVVVSKFHDDRWDYGLRCGPSCATFADPKLAHRIAAEAAQRAAAATGQRLRYEAFDSSTGRVEGAVRAMAGR
jgi:hypothetical protein